MDLGIAGRVALVTGASKGIGRGIAAALAAEGARVVVASRSAERAATAAREAGAETSFAHDTGDVDGAAGLVARVTEALGPVDILVANSGGPPAGPDPLAFDDATWAAAYRTLVLGPMALIGAVVPGMRERGWGRVVSVSSSAAREPIGALMLSNAHRPGLLAAFKTMAGAYAADGVTFNSVLPGRIATDRVFDTAGSREAAEAAARDEVPAGRLGTVEELAAAAVFLCSDPARYITGETIRVDGGVTRAV